MNAFILLIVVAIASIVYGYGYTANLTPGQWGSIRRILTHPETPLEIAHKTRKVIYVHYESWALHRAQTFRKSRPGLCKHISNDELAVYASRGLIRAIQGCDFDYLRDTPFSVYASKWIDYELLDGMTELQAITTLPKRFHKRKGIHNRRYFRVRPIANREFYAKKRIQDEYAEKHSYEEAWEEVDTAISDVFENRVFRLKYSATLDKLRSNAEIAELMGCSEETVRKAFLGRKA